MDEVAEQVPQQAEVLTEIRSNADDEVVALFCDYKPGHQGSGEESAEIVKGGEKYFRLKAGQFKKMTRGTAQWHVGKSRRWDETNPLMLEIKTLEEIQALQNAADAKKHAKADAEAIAAKEAKAVQDKIEAEAKAAADVRRDLLDKALGAGAIASSKEAEALTNKDLAEMTASALAAKKS